MGTVAIVIILILSHAAAAFVGHKYGARGKAALNEAHAALQAKKEAAEKELQDLRTGVAGVITNVAENVADIVQGPKPPDAPGKGA